jgi:hypothetical protein
MMRVSIRQEQQSPLDLLLVEQAAEEVLCLEASIDGFSHQRLYIT